MKNTVFTLLLPIIISTALYAQEPDFAWVKRIGDNSSSSSGMYNVVTAVDAQGNSYLAAAFTGQTFTIDGITVSSGFTSPFSNNTYGFLAKYDPNGQIIWAKSMLNVAIGSKNPGFCSSKMIIDEQGSIYLTGLYSFNTYRFSVLNDYYLTDTTTQSGYIGTEQNMFLAKLAANGDVLWVKKASHPVYESGSGISNNTGEIHFDLAGNINLTGAFHNSISFAPGYTLTTDTDEATIFLTKYSPSGELLQAQKLAGETYPKGEFGTEHVRADASGNLYRWSNRSASNPRRLYRYDAAGELLDSLNLTISATTNYPELKGFAVSPGGDVFIGGAFSGNLNLEGIVYNGFGNSSTDGVLFKLAAPDYDVDWVKTQLTGRSDSFEQLLTDGLGNVYATGNYGNAQESASVLHKYTVNGVLIWGKLLTGLSTPQTPTTGFVTVTSLCQSQNGGNIWVGGWFSRNAYFSTGDHFTTPALNHYNGFLAQYGLCTTAAPVMNTPVTTKLCGQESILLSASLTPGLTYFWSTPGGNVAIGSSETTTTLTVTEPGHYYLVAQEDAECYGKSQEIWITRFPLPDVTVIQEAATLTAVAANTYQWLDCDNDSVAINGATGVSFTAVQNGHYAVEVTTPSGCTDTSACFTVSNLNIAEQIDLTPLISIYPNPTKEEINVEGTFTIKSVRILDLQGKELIRLKGNKVTISGLSAGAYLIEIATDEGIGTKRFIKE